MKLFITFAKSLCCQAPVYDGLFTHKYGECQSCNKCNGYQVIYPEPSMSSI